MAANFGCDLFRIMLEIVFKLLLTSIGSGCAVPLLSEQTALSLQHQTPFSWTGHRLRSDDLHISATYTGFNSQHVDLFLCPIFTKRPINDHKIE